MLALKMVRLLQCFIILFTIVVKSTSIQPEYYLDNDKDKNEDYDNINKTENRRTGDKNDELLTKTNNVTSINDTYDDYDEYTYNEDSFLKVYVMTRKSQNKLVNTTGTATHNSTTTISRNNTNNNKKISTLMSNTTINYATTINVNQQYEYIYDDDSSTPSELLRMDSSYESTSTTETTTNNAMRKSVTKSNSMRYLADFYNLSPAINTINLNNSFVKNNSGDIWYVPEKYPCFDLPILYGRLGRKKQTSDVFLVFSGRLKNVIDIGPEDVPKSRNYMIPDVAKTINKWCAAAPCFGDHSLCLFSEKHNSKICDKDYQVRSPTIIEKTAIVNTINSMRNRIANGDAETYLHLPPATNMKQIIYDYDLQDMAAAWLRQCLPGTDPCSSLDNAYVTQLECKKSADHCCVRLHESEIVPNCVPKYECFTLPVIGCLHVWFGSAGHKLTKTDVECGHSSYETFNTVQLIWAQTNKIGCAYGARMNGDIRVICNFAPGAPFYVDSKYYCGLISHSDISENFPQINSTDDVTDLKFLASLGVVLNEVNDVTKYGPEHGVAKTFDKNLTRILRTSDLDMLHQIYKPGWIRKALDDYSNGTKGMIAQLVAKYIFIEQRQARCDEDEPIYVTGPPGSQCIERGQRFNTLCYDFADSTRGYRLAAILAPIALFTLILYDLFSGVVRQNNY